MDPVMNRIGDACSNRPVYFYVAVTDGYSESWSQWTFSNSERLFMSTAATSAPWQQGALCYRALVNYYWTNLPLVLLMLAQALGVKTTHERCGPFSLCRLEPNVSHKVCS